VSRIYFTTQHEGTREVLGSERAYMGMLCNDLASGLMPHWREDLDAILLGSMRGRLAAYASDAARHDIVRMYLRHEDQAVFHLNGEPLENFDLVLNTVLVMGSDPLCLLARLHGQCEIHAYVEGPNRAWMASLIRQGLAAGLYRRGMGWESVADLLEQSDAEPVVTSYSVTGGFPGHHVAEDLAPDGVDVDTWYDGLTDGQRWEHSIVGLRSRATSLTDLRPGNLRARFGHGKSMFDLLNTPRPVAVGAPRG
jgi:hypothetical protein